MKRYVIGNRENNKFVVKGDYGNYIWVDDPAYAAYAYTDSRNNLEKVVKMYKEQRDWFDRQTIPGPELKIYELKTVEVDYDEWSDIEDEARRKAEADEAAKIEADERALLAVLKAKYEV